MAAVAAVAAVAAAAAAAETHYVAAQNAAESPEAPLLVEAAAVAHSRSQLWAAQTSSPV